MAGVRFIWTSADFVDPRTVRLKTDRFSTPSSAEPPRRGGLDVTRPATRLKGKTVFSRGLGSRPPAGLSVYLDVFGQAVARLAAAARPHAGDCFYFPLLFESLGGRRGRMRGRWMDGQ